MILIDYKDRRPLYEQIVEKLSDLMVRGILEQDSQLPSGRSLATELSMNPNTIQRAYAELERQGYIYSVKGRGSFVADNRQIRERKRQEIWDQLELLIRAVKKIVRGQSVDNRLSFLYTTTVLNELIHLLFLIQDRMEERRM